METGTSAARAKAAAAAALAPGRGDKSARWWFVLQGTDVTTVRSVEMPDLTTAKGERRKRIVGSAVDEAGANAMAARLSKRVLGTVTLGGA